MFTYCTLPRNCYELVSAQSETTRLQDRKGLRIPLSIYTALYSVFISCCKAGSGSKMVILLIKRKEERTIVLLDIILRDIS